MSQIAVRIKEAGEQGQTHSMELIFFPLFIILFVGVIFNALNSSGLQANGNLQTTTTGIICYLGQGNCSPIINPTPTGCVANPQNCNASGITTFSLLNQNSPFTYALQGNLIGFWSSIFGGGETTNQYVAGETICIPLIDGKLANASLNANILNFRCYGYVSDTNAIPTPSVLPPLNASSNGGNMSIWNIIGCPNNTNCGVGFTNITYAYQTFFGLYVRNGTVIDSTHGCTIYGSTTICRQLFPFLFGSSPTFTCPNTAHVQGLNINRTTYYCLLPSQAQGTITVANTFSFFALIAGMILLFMGFGFNIMISLLTNGGSLGINEQGTKMAQVFGIGLTIWSFITSEFAYWVFSPYGSGLIGSILTLTFTAVYSVLGIMFFLGLYWRMFSLD
jgi:hypothetical protein